jgi:hypothetical protein
MKINEGKTESIYFSRKLKDALQLNGRTIHFVNSVKYFGVNTRMTWRLHIDRSVAKAMRTYRSLRKCSLIKSERLSTNIKFTLYKALIRSIMTYMPVPPGSNWRTLTF